MKLIGAVLILTGSLAAGLLAVRRMDYRIAALRALIAALDILGHELDCFLPSMPDWLRSSAERSPEPAASFFNLCARRLCDQDGTALAELWNEAARQRLGALKSGDLEPVLTLGPVLGRYDADSQRRSIGAARKQLEAKLAEAAARRRDSGRVCTVLCAAAGTLLVVVLL